MKNDNEKMLLTATSAVVLKGEYACHECECIVPVFAAMLVGPFQGESPMPLEADDDSALLSRPRELPSDLADALTLASKGNYRPDSSKTVADTYWMNHCQECGAKIGDWFVNKPGEAFFPTTEEERLKLIGNLVNGPLSFTDPDVAVSSWTSAWLQFRFEGLVEGGQRSLGKCSE